MGKEQFGEFGLVMERANDCTLLDPHDLAFRQRRCGRDALWLSGQAAFAAEFILPEDGDHSLLAMFGNDRDLAPSFLDIKDGIRDGSLREDRLTFAVQGNRPAFTNFGEEVVGMKRFYVAYHLACSLNPAVSNGTSALPRRNGPCFIRNNRVAFADTVQYSTKGRQR